MESKIFWNLYAFMLLVLCSGAAAYDALDPKGNITIKWDVLSWTPDGYVAVVTMNNFQMYRPIMSPGWTLGWTWAKNEVIWAMSGAQATYQGDCSKFRSNIPHSCEKNPAIVDLLPNTPYNQQVANCCKGGVLASRGKDPSASLSAFQISVGAAGTTDKTVKLPKNFTLVAPVTWRVICTYSQFLASPIPTCCVSLSSFHNRSITPCPSCSCGCQNSSNCIVKTPSGKGISVLNKVNEAVLQCTKHMCPINVHWHVKSNYKKYWRVKITITNFNYRFNYTQWTLVVQHPNLNNATQVSSFLYKPLMPNPSTNDTALFYGRESYNDILMQAGPKGNVHSDLTLQKDGKTIALKKGWAFPRRVYFNGNLCVMPSPESYPYLPNSAGTR
ncbi:COBRA-like protein 4 isoform X1 [Lycium ferocissimum]|uniref:COBRA-like protein 4 isoform X1 n=1 Tax=Lycium ferocissimum TaxID=112874 RepID=UPI0028159837|nr:COBRA-like protein 4 isoform X1 [Lycium ferocissimum]